MDSKNKESYAKKHVKEYFSNNFIWRFFIWIFGTIFLLFGVVFIIAANLGLGTYDAFFRPLSILLGIKNNNGQYGYLLMIVGTIFYLVATLMNYIRTKKIRIDYLLGIIYAIIAGFIIKSLLMDVPFINNMLVKTSKASMVFIKYSEVLIILFVGIMFFMIGIGTTTACNIIPNNYAILVEEISIASNRSFKFVQYAFDISLITGGLLITIMNIYVTNKNTWFDVFKFIGFGTLILFLLQSQVINYSLLQTRAIIDRINKKGK